MIVGVCGLAGGMGRTSTAIGLAVAAQYPDASVRVVEADADFPGDASAFVRVGGLDVRVEAVARGQLLSHLIEVSAEEHVFVDMPPGSGPALAEIASFADVVVVPVDALLRSLGNTLAVLRRVQQGRPGLRVYVLRAAWSPRTRIAQAAEAVLEDLGIALERWISVDAALDERWISPRALVGFLGVWRELHTTRNPGRVPAAFGRTPAPTLRPSLGVRSTQHLGGALPGPRDAPLS